MSTRSSIWLGEKDGKCVHIYWELAEREHEGKMMRAPIYIAADAGDPEREIAIRLPKEIALKLLMVLGSDLGNKRQASSNSVGPQPKGSSCPIENESFLHA
jgi:hypothetical protein